MSHNNGIITAPVSALTDVPTVIGIGSYDVGTQIAKAASGGKGGYAFSIRENGGAANDGRLIDGARPYWNIYSNKSPGEWKPAVTVDGPLVFELKRFLDDATKGYAFGLHHFDGYDHHSTPPTVGGGEYHFTQGAASGMLVREFTFKPMLGSYDWRKVAGATLYMAAISGESIGTVYGTPTEISSEAKTINITITINTNYPATYNYSLYVYIGSGTVNDFNSLGYVPDVGSMRVIIDPKPVMTASVVVEDGGHNYFNAFVVSDGVTFSGTTKFSGEYRLNSGVNTSNKKLKEMVYSWGSAEAGNEGSLSVTSFNYKEGPSYLKRYIVGDNIEGFEADPSRVPGGFRDNYHVTYWYG